MSPMNVAKKMMLLKLGGAGSGGAAPAITYLFRDEFTTDESAPLTSPRPLNRGRVHPRSYKRTGRLRKAAARWYL